MVFLMFVACGPLSGNYTFTVTDEGNDCPDELQSLGSPAGGQTIEIDSTTEMTLRGDPDEPCELDGMAFACHFDDLDDEVDYADQGYDAIFAVDAEMDGEWDTATTLTATFSVGVACTGDDCGKLAKRGLPECSMFWDLDGTL